MRIRLLACLLVLPILVWPGVSRGEVILDAGQELQLILRGEAVERRIAGAENRIAVFSYEDPHGTGLGDALASLVARRILSESRVGSIGVLRYQGRLAPLSPDHPDFQPGQPSYFDAVDLIAKEQNVTLSVWGIVRSLSGQLHIQTFVQIPETRIDEHFQWTMKLPERMGSGELVARLRPDRILVQDLAIPLSAAANLLAAADRVNVVRAAASTDAEVIRTLPLGDVYTVLERDGDWIKVSAGPGWVSTGAQCDGECQEFTAAADFGMQLLRYMALDTTPLGSPDLTPEVDSVVAQIQALDGLEGSSPSEIESRSLAIARNRAWGRIDQAGRVPPGGAAFDNILLMGEIAIGLHVVFQQMRQDVPDEDSDRLFDMIELNPERIRSLAFDLANASLIDPRNPDVLHNLSVLFEYAGDMERANRAAQLAARSQGANSGP